jgi:hypothetical protein
LITSTERRDKHIQPPRPHHHQHRPGSLPTNADTAQTATTEHVATRDRSTIKPPKIGTRSVLTAIHFSHSIRMSQSREHARRPAIVPHGSQPLPHGLATRRDATRRTKPTAATGLNGIHQNPRTRLAASRDEECTKARSSVKPM